MLLDDLGSVLVTGGHGTLGTDLFLGRLPDAPDACLALREYEGAAPTRVHNAPGKGVVYEAAQLVARAATQVAAREAIRSAWRTLRVIRNQAVGNGASPEVFTTYLWVKDNAPPFPMRVDDKDRWEFAVNFTAAVSEEP